MSLDKFDEDLQFRIMEVLLKSFPAALRSEKLRKLLDSESDLFDFNITYLCGKKLVNLAFAYEDLPDGEEAKYAIYQLSSDGIDLLRSRRSL